MNEIEHYKLVKYLYLPFLLIMGTIFGVSVNYFKTEFSNADDYFYYESIQPLKDNFEIGEDVFFTSVLNRLKETDMKYVDILRCDLWQDYTWFSQSVSYSQDLQPWEYVSVWRYEWKIPEVEWTCYLDSSPTVRLWYWVTKTQKIISNFFTIWGQ